MSEQTDEWLVTLSIIMYFSSLHTMSLTIYAHYLLPDKGQKLKSIFTTEVAHTHLCVKE